VALSYLPNPNPGGTNGLWSIKGNTIAGNDAGIVIRSGRFITLSENSIYDNVKPAGIDLVQRFPLGQQGVTLNDANDVDNWNGFNSNHGLNYPVLTAATLNATGTTLTVNGTLDDNPEFGIKKRIEIFANPAPLPVGKREGRIYLGSADIVTDNLPGPKAFVLNINIPVGIPAANINNIVAVTTEREIVFVPPPYGISPYLNMPEPPFPTADYLNFVGFAMPMGSSSEFSAPLAVIAAGGGNPPPVPWNPVPPPVDPKAGVIPVKPTSAQ
jgi:parallel beta-helix repeat protein